MPRGIPNPKPPTIEMQDAQVVTVAPVPEPIGSLGSVTISNDQPAPTPEPVRMIVVKLLKNYRPRELPDPANKGKYLPPVFEIVGYHSPAILKKNAAGVMETIQEERFIENEQPPPPTPGTGSETKIWAGTVLKVASDEAKTMRKAGIAEYEILD